VPLNHCGTVAHLLAEGVYVSAFAQQLHSGVSVTQLVKHRDQRYFTACRGKQWLLQQFDDMLSGEDDYFAEDTLRQVEEAERWNLFLNTCVAYACLSTYLAGSALPIELD
jgi:hypothetical protein